MITAEVAVVYKANGRRYLTARAAAGAAARGKIKERCECDYCDHPEMPGAPTEHLPCGYHNDSPRAAKIMRRLSRAYLKAFREARK